MWSVRDGPAGGGVEQFEPLDDRFSYALVELGRDAVLPVGVPPGRGGIVVGHDARPGAGQQHNGESLPVAEAFIVDGVHDELVDLLAAGAGGLGLAHEADRDARRVAPVHLVVPAAVTGLLRGHQPGNDPAQPARQNKSFSDPSWTLGLSYQATDDWLLYLTARRSWRAGGFNGTAPAAIDPGNGDPIIQDTNLFDPETTHDVEAGVKFAGHVLGRPLRMNLAVYNQWIKDVQRAEFPDPPGPAASIAYTVNVPEAEVSGIEFDATVKPVRWLETQPDIAQVLTREQVMVAAPAEGTPVDKLTMAERFHESFDPARSGDIFVVLPEHVSSSVPGKAGAAVAGHGSPWDYDRLVPILFWWPAVAGQTVTRPIETVDIAPTLAAIAGVRTPQLDGHCLPEVVTCP